MKIDKILSKNEPYRLEVYKANTDGTFIEHEVSTVEEWNTLLKIWGEY